MTMTTTTMTMTMTTKTTTDIDISRRRLCYPRPIHILCILLVMMGIQTTRMNGLPSFESVMTPEFDYNSTSSTSSDATTTPTSNSAVAADNDKANGPAVDVVADVDGGKKAFYQRLSLDELMAISAASSSSVTLCEPNTRHIGASTTVKTSTTTRTGSMTDKTRIPKIIHQMDISPCLPDNLYKAAESWKNVSEFDYYFHTNETMQALLDQDWPEFPHLSSISNCVPSYEGMVNLWKALCLWEFGGAVVDLDIIPLENFGEIFVESNVSQEAILFSWQKRKYLKLRGELVLTAPQHPIAYYWVMHTLNNIMRLKSMVNVPWGEVTGLSPLDNAWWYMVCTDVGGKKKKPETWEEYRGLRNGRYNRTASLLMLDKYTQKGNLDGNWRVQHYPKVSNIKKWNMTCMSVVYDVLAGPADLTNETFAME